MCIGALAEQIDTEHKSKVDWSDFSSRKYYICYDNKDKEYYICGSLFSRTLGVVYMSKDVSEKVCEILNNEGVEL